MADLCSDARDPKKCIEQILAIAPILPGSGAQQGSVKQPNAATTPGKQATTTAPPVASTHQATSNLIDLDSRPSSTAPSEPNAAAQKQNKSAVDHHNALHPTSNPQQIQPVHQSTATTAPIGNPPKQGNLLDMDDDVQNTTNKMSDLNVSHQAMQPRSPLLRTDTETSEADVFVDAEEK